MKNGKIIKRVLLWIAVALLGAVLVPQLYYLTQPDALPPDYFHGVEPDLGEGPEERVMSYVQSHMMLGDSTYKVRVGVSQFDSNSGDKWDYYFLWISKIVHDEVYGERGYAFWERWIPANGIPEKWIPDALWKKDVGEIVSYDGATRTVTLNCGFTNYTCTLPPE